MENLTENSIEKIEQLKCRICNGKLRLNENEIQDWIDWKNKNGAEEDAIFLYFNLIHKRKCPGKRYHEYRWNEDFEDQILSDSSKRKFGEIDITKKTNEIEIRGRIMHENTGDKKEITPIHYNKLEDIDKAKTKNKGFYKKMLNTPIFTELKKPVEIN